MVPLNIKDGETERLVAEVAMLANETKTQAVRVALRERRERLLRNAAGRKRGDSLRRFLDEEAWPQVPPPVLGVAVSKAEREAVLGYGPSGI